MTTLIDTVLHTPRVIWNEVGDLGLGARLDGAGQAWFDLIDDRHTSGGVIAGPPRSGRSNTATLIAAAARAHLALRVSTFYVDAHGGAANPVLAKAASTRVTGDTPPSAAAAALRRAVRYRIDLASERGLRTLAGTEVPIVLTVVEDAAQVVGDKPHRWSWIARRAPLLNIAILCVLDDVDRDGYPGQRALWRLLGKGNRLHLRPGRPGIARIRDPETCNEIDARIPHLGPWAEEELGHDDVLDAGTAAAFGDLHTPRPS